MATITISLSGSAIAGLTTNPSKSYTVSDADLQSLLNWAQGAFNPFIQATYNPTGTPGFVPTTQQVLLAWVQSWVNATTNSVQQFETPAPAVPTKISLT